MFNSTIIESELKKDKPIVALIFCSSLLICCLCGCKYYIKWSSAKPILPILPTR